MSSINFLSIKKNVQKSKMDYGLKNIKYYIGILEDLKHVEIYGKSIILNVMESYLLLEMIMIE